MGQAQVAQPTTATQVLRLPQQGLTNGIESSIGLSKTGLRTMAQCGLLEAPSSHYHSNTNGMEGASKRLASSDFRAKFTMWEYIPITFSFFSRNIQIIQENIRDID